MQDAFAEVILFYQGNKLLLETLHVVKLLIPRDGLAQHTEGVFLAITKLLGSGLCIAGQFCSLCYRELGLHDGHTTRNTNAIIAKALFCFLMDTLCEIYHFVPTPHNKQVVSTCIDDVQVWFEH